MSHDVDAELMFGAGGLDHDQLEREAAWKVLDNLDRGGALNLPLLRELYRGARRKHRHEMVAIFRRWGIMLKALQEVKGESCTE